MVECELKHREFLMRRDKGFNRYMVECELNARLAFSGISPVLIDTWWNVNCVTAERIISESLVLIDTWWNVNVIAIFVPCLRYFVLIDTWWNVNFPFMAKTRLFCRF